MSFFKNIKNLTELKAEYRRLALENHPDKGGSTEKMQELNAEFDLLFRTLNIMEPAHARTEETADAYRRQFYTANGWAGENYSVYRTTKEITALIRDGIKQMYPLTKWSVSFHSYSGGSTIRVMLMEAPYNVFREDADIKFNSYDLNQYHLDKETNLTEQALDMFQKVNALIRSYHFSDCDGMIDYFDVNFWYDISIGKWDKPFKVVPKTPRIGVQANPKDKKVVANYGKYDFSITPDVDTRDQSEMYVVKCSTPLDRDEYGRLAALIKTIGGYYSKFKHGFIFRENPSEKLKAIMA